jgi:geranylgeranyl transferase type-1 subunit beta
MGRLWDESVLDKKQIELLKKWAVMKQQRGFHGRTNKPDDSCYAFWIGATLTVINIKQTHHYI